MSFDVGIFWASLPILMRGVGTTCVLVTASLTLGSVIGLLVCAGTLLRQGLVYRLSLAYVSLFRTLPETVLFFWLYSCIPLILSDKPTPLQCGIWALVFPAGAYLAEIFRAGIE